MAQLAIKGHATRGKEVIVLLEMLGGKNKYNCWGLFKERLYLINAYGDIEDISLLDNSNYQIYTLEEFLEKYPYKVGDKVQHKGDTSCGTVEVIERMRWVNTKVEYEIRPLYDCNHTGLVTVDAEDLQPYKEETMLERIVDITRESDGRYRLKVNDQFDIEADEGEYYIIPKKSKYPKTHVECCEILYPNENFQTVAQPVKGHEGKKLFALQKLLICRDAYWKITGEEMCLGRPWKPDWIDDCQPKYIIVSRKNSIAKVTYTAKNSILAFPSAEMRDAFYENFKELIELAKEFL